MAVEPVKIPQNVYIEDRIVGPLTLRQTMIMAGGGGFSYALYSMISRTLGHPPDTVTTVILWIPAVIAFAFALIKVNDLTLGRIVLLTLERTQKAPVRTWAPRRGLSITIRTSAPIKDNRAALALKSREESEKKIRELSQLVDTGMMLEDVMPDPVREADQAAAKTASHAKAEAQDEPDDGFVEDEPTEPSAPTAPLPVDPSRIRANDAEPGGTKLSDLSIFRDIFNA